MSILNIVKSFHPLIVHQFKSLTCPHKRGRHVSKNITSHNSNVSYGTISNLKNCMEAGTSMMLRIVLLLNLKDERELYKFYTLYENFTIIASHKPHREMETLRDIFLKQGIFFISTLCNYLTLSKAFMNIITQKPFEFFSNVITP